MNLSVDILDNQDLLGRHKFLTDNPGIAVPVVIILSLGAVFGTFGNALILITICRTKKLQRLECIFMANLAISDMYITLIGDPMSIVAKTEGEEFFNGLPRFCYIIACGCTIACINSLGSIALLAFNRYIYICYFHYYTNIFTPTKCILMCCCLYCVGLFLVLLNFADIGGHSFDRKSLECIWDRMETYSFTVVFSVVLVWIPLTVIGFSYISIFRVVLLSQRRTHMQVSKSTLYTNGLARTFFIIYAVFSTCWIPYALIIVLDTKNTFSLEAHVCVTVWAHLHPSFNWLIYYLTNTKIADAFNKIAHLDVCFGICRRAPSEEVSTTGVEPTTSDTHDQKQISFQMS